MATLDSILTHLGTFKSIIQVRPNYQHNRVVVLVYTHHPKAEAEAQAIRALVDSNPLMLRVFNVETRPTMTLQ